MSAFRGLVRKETMHLLRDRRTLAILLLMPVIQVLLFGFAVRTEVTDVPLAIVEPAPDHLTAALRSRLEASDIFRIVTVDRTDARLESLFQRGDIRQAMVLESRFAERLERGEGAGVLVITDAADPNSGRIMTAYATTILRQLEAELAPRAPALRIEPRVRMRYNPGLESVNLFVPGLVAFVLTLVSALMTALSIAREKEMGTMEVLLASPLRPRQVVMGKVLPYVALGFANVLMVLAAARLVFEVPVRGSVALLLAECVLYLVAALALGVLISTRAATQRTAMIAALAGLMLPTLILSGFVFPLESMPVPLQVLARIFPARWFVEIVRGIMIKGSGLTELWQETTVLAGLTVVLLAASARRLPLRLE